MAQFTDFIYILAIIFMTVVTLMTATLIVTTVISTGIFDDNPTASEAITITRSTLLNFDNLLLFVIVGLSLSVLVGSAVVYNHPGFFIVSMFLLCITVVVAAIMSNTLWTFMNMDAIVATAALYPKITFLMNRLPFYIAFMGIASAILAYTSFQRQ